MSFFSRNNFDGTSSEIELNTAVW